MNLNDKLLVTYAVPDEDPKTIWILDEGRQSLQNPSHTRSFRVPVQGVISPDHLKVILEHETPLSKSLQQDRLRVPESPYDRVRGILAEARVMVTAVQAQVKPEHTEHSGLAEVFRNTVSVQVDQILKRFVPAHPEFAEFRIAA